MPTSRLMPLRTLQMIFRKPLHLARVLFDRALAKRGYTLARTGGAYIDARSTIEAAKAAGMTIHDYIYRDASAEKKGRTDRIIQRIQALLETKSELSVVEIGTGSGIYLERLCKAVKCKAYHIFETDAGWQSYARDTLAKRARCIVHKCDGTTLKEVNDNSIDLVHAHGVFVYTPSLVTLSYISEAARVLKLGGKFVFDCYLDSNFGRLQVDNWMASEHRFPIIIPEGVLFDQFARNNLKVTSIFREIHGPDYVDYLVCEKTPTP